MEVGAFTPFLWMISAASGCGSSRKSSPARLTHSYVRIGGVAADLTPDFSARLRDVLASVARRWSTSRSCW